MDVIFSRVALVIPLKDAEGAQVTNHLKVAPSRIRENIARSGQKKGEMLSRLVYQWEHDSPKDASVGIGLRLLALAEIIAPFSSRLVSLGSSYLRWIDVFYQMSPNKEQGRVVLPRATYT